MGDGGKSGHRVGLGGAAVRRRLPAETHIDTCGVSQATKVLHILLTGVATLALKDYDAFRQTVTQ